MSSFFAYFIILCVNFFCFLNPIQSKELQVEPKTSIVQAESEAPIVILETTLGIIELRLFPKIAPKACKNFIALTGKEYYNGVGFHRVIRDFMIQGGDPKGNGTGGQSIWGTPFENEVTDEKTFDRKGLLAMANAGPNTNGSQFFITTAPTPWLNMKHTIFGEVLSGYDIVDKIQRSKTDLENRPVKKIAIIKAYLKAN